MGASGARTQQVQVLPGVSYERHTDLTPQGPVSYTAITLPVPASGGAATLGPVLPGGTLTAPSATLPQLTEANPTSIGIVGDFTNPNGTRPNGIVVSGGALEHNPTPARSAIGFTATGAMIVGRLSFAGTWQGSGQRRPVAAVNQAPGKNQTVLFTPAYGSSTPAVVGASAVVLEPFPSAQVDTDLKATVAAVADGSVPTPIPADGAVLLGTGTAAPKLVAEAAAGQAVTVRLTLPAAWAGVTEALGGGPLLVRNGKPVFHTGETFDVAALGSRDARAAVGQLADGRIVLVAVDGGRPGASVGLTNYELARELVSLGAVTAAGLQYGKAVTASFDGTLLDRPSGGAPRPLREALLYRYAGVYAPSPSVPVVTGPGVAEQLQYRLSRPSTVTASVIDPSGGVHAVDSGARTAGTYPFVWTTFDREGTWHWKVDAVDDQGRRSSTDVAFAYDLTVSGLTVPAVAQPPAGLKVGFTLSRPAAAVLQIETRNGTIVDTERSVQLPAGPGALTWDGTTTGKGVAPAGSYVAVVTETSKLGTSTASAPFRWNH